jgi:hypothetical protein
MSENIGKISGIMLGKRVTSTRDNLERLGSDLKFENNLLYLDVTSNRVGIKSDTSDYDLDATGIVRSTNLISDLGFTNGDTTINSSGISTNLGSINFSAAVSINAPEIQTDALSFNDNVISTTTTNATLELRPTGSGIVDVYNALNLTGNLYATGDITLDGLITFGNQSTDTVTFNAEVDSDIIPDQDNLYSLGSSASTRWSELYTVLYNGQQITTGSLVTDAGINLALRPGNILFVATNGNDSNQGNHENSPFATLEHALSVASLNDTVRIYPGTYQETFPLTVPVGVTVKGTGIRSVTVVPTPATNTENAFLLNGETTITDLTVKDFYTGSAFSFAPGFKVTTRSPYIQNISVITAESSLGAADAGAGAYVDGSLADATTSEASMLFHSCTFITPNSNAVTVTNGVRVEWLSCFTYFAARGLYATQGVLGQSSLGIKFGAEVRAVGSANVYGTYGAVADGADTLMDLIQHNFAYVGTGLDSSNDSTIAVQANEVVRLNNGIIHYQSFNKGMFRVGDTFYVDLETGTSSFDTAGITFSALSALTITTGFDSTVLNPAEITTGNWSVSGNTLLTTAGAANILAASGTINLTQDVNIAKNLAITGDFQYEGNLTLGNQTSDTLVFEAPLDQNLAPDDDGNFYNLGSSAIVWKNVWAGAVEVDDITINSNTITASTTNTDLEIIANGIGNLLIPSNNAIVDNSLTASNTFIKAVGITGLLSQTGNRTQLGAYNLTGNYETTGHLQTTLIADFTAITIQNNSIFTKQVDTDLRLEPNGVGIVSVESTNVYINNNLSIDILATTNGVTVTGRTTSNTFYTGDISINSNNILTTATDSNLTLIANGSGRVYLETIGLQTNYIVSTDNIVVTPSTTSQFVIDTTGSLIVPVGTNINRPIKTLGDLRFNTTDLTFEGSDGTATRGFSAVYSSNRLTSVKATKTSNILNFTTSSVSAMDIDSARLRANGLYVDTLQFNNSTITSANNITFAANGTGTAVIGSITLDDNNFLNNTLTLQSTGQGYYVLAATTAVVIPYGNDASRSSTPTTGETRYSVEQGYIEVWDGASWANSAGVGDTVTAQYMEDTSYLWNLILG